MRRRAGLVVEANVIIQVTGEPPRRVHNLVTDAGLGLVLDRMEGTGVGALRWACGYGEGNTAVAASDTGLATEIDETVEGVTIPMRRLFDPTRPVGGGLALYTYLELAAGNGRTIREVGVFTSDDADATLYARALVNPDVMKTPQTAVGVTWILSWGRASI